jgi:hypothetical protein
MGPWRLGDRQGVYEGRGRALCSTTDRTREVKKGRGPEAARQDE